jgi:tRNA pseudouridine55 synthase
MNVKPAKRAVNGILLLDKALGISSNKALQQVKYLYAAQKAGHTGSLDPLASGMLPICFGEATKFSHYLLNADKHYHVKAKLGIKTTTGDAEGEVISCCVPNQFNKEQLEHKLHPFRGKQQQIPSMFSALKHQGQPLYKLARMGMEVERQARSIEVFSLQLLDYQLDEMSLLVHCSKGTYIRNLVEDIGEALGCGAHVTMLRRLQVNGYPTAMMKTQAELEQQHAIAGIEGLASMLLPVDYPVQHWPAIQLSDSLAFYLKRGQAVALEQAYEQTWARIFAPNDIFLGIGEVIAENKLVPKRLLNLS